MLTEEQKETIKRYLKAIAEINSDTKYKNDGKLYIVACEHYDKMEIIRSFAVAIIPNIQIICPEFMLIHGAKRSEEIEKQFTAEEVKMIWLNIHYIGEIIKDDPIVKEYKLSPRTPYKKGEIGDPFYRMFDEITKGEK